MFFSLDASEKDIFTHGGPSAFPLDHPHTMLPSSLFGWTDKSLNGYMYDNMRALSAELIQANQGWPGPEARCPLHRLCAVRGAAGVNVRSERTEVARGPFS